MHEKFDYYDIFSNIIPGIVLIAGLYILFYWFGIPFQIPAFSDGILVLVMLGIAVFAGNILQALSSLLEPFYFWTWGGKPSEKLMLGKSRRLSSEYIDLLKKTVKRHTQYGESLAQSDRALTNNDLFLHCLTICNQKSLGRVNRFNSLYAYHRSLTTLMLIFLVVTIVTLFKATSSTGGIWVILGELLVVIILWNRTRERGYYLAEEVLRVGACEITSPTAKKDDK